MPEVTAIIPTLGRKSLADATRSLKLQTESVEIIVLKDPRDTLVKIKEGMEKAKTELVAICDDDAVYPVDWISRLSREFTDEQVAYAGGAVLPYIREDSNHVERAIGQITSSFFGTSNMSYRQKVPSETKDADEMNLIGNGMYRRADFLQVLQDYDKIPAAAWETYILTKLRAMGKQTLSVKGVYFWHKQRDTIGGFIKQMYRCGIGRANYFKQFPRQALKKYFIFAPSAAILYLTTYAVIQLYIHATNATFPPTWGLIPIITYAIIDLVACIISVKSERILSFFMFPLMHLSYGLGIISGLFRSIRRWT